MPSHLSAEEQRVHNAGERIIPGVTQDTAELIRHRSSYFFFKTVIEGDLRRGQVSDRIRILDIGCGVGHGCRDLAEIPGAFLLGIDYSPDAIEYACNHYRRDNVEYEVADLAEFVAGRMPEFEYVVSRGALEHIPRGIELAHASNWRARLLFDVPYDEPAGVNEHHVLHNLRESDMKGLKNPEFFYQDIRGVIYRRRPRKPPPNMILCACRRNGIPQAGREIAFPVQAWTPPGWEWPPRNWTEAPLLVRLGHRAWLTVDWYLGKLRALIRRDSAS